MRIGEPGKTSIRSQTPEPSPSIVLCGNNMVMFASKETKNNSSFLRYLLYASSAPLSDDQSYNAFEHAVSSTDTPSIPEDEAPDIQSTSTSKYTNFSGTYFNSLSNMDS